MYKVKVNNGEEQEIIFSGNGFTVDSKAGTWDLIRIGTNRFHILKDNRSYTCEVLNADQQKKLFEIIVNGTIYTIEVKDRFSELLKKLGMENSSARKVNQIRSPMPGLVLNIMVEKDQEVKHGDSVLILEAMKMENIIKSPCDGKVKVIRVQIKDAVEKNQVLVEFV